MTTGRCKSPVFRWPVLGIDPDPGIPVHQVGQTDPLSPVVHIVMYSPYVVEQGIQRVWCRPHAHFTSSHQTAASWDSSHMKGISVGSPLFQGGEIK